MKIIEVKEQDSCFEIIAEGDSEKFKSLYFSHMTLVASTISVAGFRKGKVPLDIAISHLGSRGLLEREFRKISERLIEHYSDRIIESEDERVKEKILRTAYDSSVEEFDTKNWVFRFKSKYEKFPKVTLGSYEKISTINDISDDLYDFCPVPKDGESSKSDFVTISMVGLDSKKEHSSKYTHESLDVDLEKTKLRKEIVDALVGMKASEEKKISFKDGEEEIEVTLQMLRVSEKRPFDEETVKSLKLPEDTTAEYLKKLLSDHQKLQKKMIRHLEVIKWILSKENSISPYPTINVKKGAFEAFERYKRERKKRSNAHKERELSFQDFLFGCSRNCKVAFVLDEIIKREKITVEDGDLEFFVKNVEENPWIYENRPVEDLLNVSKEETDSFIQQFKAMEFLKKRLIFSN